MVVFMILVSYAGSVVIVGKSLFDMLNKLGDYGLKFDAKKYNMAYEELKRENKKERFIEKVLFFIPGVNIFYTLLSSKKSTKEFVEYMSKKGAFIPMTDEEREEFDNTRYSYNRFISGLYLIAKLSEDEKKEEKNMNYSGTKTIYKTKSGKNSCTLDIDVLLDGPVGWYTLDEIEELNSVTPYSYRLGKVEDLKETGIAVLSYKDEDCDIESIKFAGSGSKKEYKFIPVSEEEAKKMTFMAYAQTVDEDLWYKLREKNRDIKVAREEKNNPALGRFLDELVLGNIEDLEDQSKSKK